MAMTVKILTRLNEAAPILSIVLVVALTMWLSHDPTLSPTFGPEQSAVAEAVDNAPYRIGQWVGVDTEIPQAAIRLLKPNAMLSRRYSNLDSNVVMDLLLVHCGDSRDMLGHYPPVCYPNAGWVPSRRQGQPERDRDAGSPVILQIFGQEYPAQMYEFSQIVELSRERRIRIFNFFVLPNGIITHDINDVGDNVNWLGASIHGVAQIQLITDQRTPLATALESATDLLEGMRDLLDSLGVFYHE